MEIKNVKDYVAPEIEVVRISVEQGYAVSTTIEGWGDGEKVDGEI
jgi:hypothetical protein